VSHLRRAALHAQLHARLQAHGFSADIAAEKAASLVQCDQALDAMGAEDADRITVWAPGRIELFGKHTDYAGGRSLLTAVERGFCVRVAPRRDAMLRVHGYDPAAGAVPQTPAVTCELPLSAAAIAPDGHWSNYVATVARRVGVNFPDATVGADIAFVSDLPQAAGASSSTALMISVFLAIAAVNRLQDTAIWQASLGSRTDLAGYLGAMEMGGPYRDLAGLPGVGTLGGCQDQTAIFCAEPGRVVDFRWMPIRHVGAYALPASCRFVIGHCGIVAEKSAGARERYNRVSLMVRHLLSSWNAHTGRTDRSLAAAAESSADAHAALRAMLPSMTTSAFTAAALRHRLDQFLLETYTLLPAAAAAFAAGDWRSVGEVTARSQHAAEVMLGNQIPETIGLVRLAKEQGAIAASAFGAGFGGSVWALLPGAVSDDAAGAFSVRWAAAYREQFPAAAARAMFFPTGAGPAAMQWPDDA
jgi:galactokinase